MALSRVRDVNNIHILLESDESQKFLFDTHDHVRIAFIQNIVYHKVLHY